MVVASLSKWLGKKPASEAPASAPANDVEAARLTTENTRLKGEARRYANMLNTSLNPVWHRDLELNIIYCNLAFSEVAEATSENVIAVGDMELYKGHRALAKRALDTGHEQSERRHIVVDGERRLYLIREVPMKGEGTIGYAVNISELEEAKAEVTRHSQALRDLLDSSTAAMAIYGRDLKLKFYNFAFVALWKHDEAFLDSEPGYGEVLEVMREKRKLPEQANFKAFKQAQLKLFTDLIEPQEEFFYLPDGKTLRVIAIPHALGGILFVYEDVTDRLALERSYNTLIAVQRETLDHLHEGIAVFGENGRLTLSNPVFRLLWKLDAEFTGNEPHIRDVWARCRELFVAEEWGGFFEGLIAKFQSRKLTTMRFDRRDGKVVSCAVVPLPDGATLLSFNDITDSTLVERSLRERAEALETADRMKTEFLANMSYELRSPLTSISGFAEMLSREYAGALTAQQKDYVGGIYQSAQHLAALIGDIIDLATIEAGYLKLDIRSFHVRQAVDAVMALLATRLKTNNAEIVVDVMQGVDLIEADEVRFKQILINLLSNALKLAKARGKITVRISRCEAGHAALTVHNEGVVLDEQRLAQLFDPFLRSGQAPGADSMLGLGLVKRFTELHGGSVHVTSTEADGTAIMCVFPPPVVGI